MIWRSIEEFADRMGFDPIIGALHECGCRGGDVLMFRFHVNLRGKGHSTICEPVFEDGDFVGSLNCITGHFDLPETRGPPLERIYCVASADGSGLVHLFEGPHGHLIP